MGSIITNQGAMVALQTLRTTQSNLTTTQNQMSTGKRVADARDNASVWSVASTMNYDVNNFSSVMDGLKSTKSAVDLALTAANNIVSAIGKMSNLITSYDPTKVSQAADINNALSSVKSQINAYIDGASFNGLNILKLTSDKSVIASLDRTGGTTVNPTLITLSQSNLNLLTSASATAGTGVALSADTTAAGNATLGDASAYSIPAAGSGVLSVGANAAVAGTMTTLTIGDKSVSYTAASNVTASTVASALKSGFESLGITGLSFGLAASGGTLATDDATAVDLTINSTAVTNVSVTSNIPAGNLKDLNGTISLATPQSTIDSALVAAQTVASKLGTLSNRLDLQTNFVSSLADSLKTGIGSMTDADMESTAARLQALQVQQQLGVQALSIANAQPQSILKLFSGQ